MKFKNQLNAVFAKLGFTDKAKKQEMSQEDWDKVFASYEEMYGTPLQADMQEAERLRGMEAEHKKILGLLEEEQPQNGGAAPSGEPSLYDAISKILQSNKELQQKVDTMIPQASADKPEAIVTTELRLNGPGNTPTHLFGIETEIFSMNHRWNQIALNPAYATLHPVKEADHAEPFHKAAMKFGASLAERYQYLKENKMLDPEKLAAGEFSFDTSHLPEAGLGDQYMIRRQDALIARILELRSVTEFFPVRYGVQDRELITNAFFTEISQAYQEGEIWKGGMELKPEYGHVDDAMVKTKFGSMKEIERQYIGYLNTDGSDPIKWSMIEFALFNLYKKMASEQNKRRMMGIYVEPESGVAGSYMNASTGVIYTLIRYMHENKLLPHDDEAYRTYDSTDFLESVQEFVGDIRVSLVEDQDLSDMVLYLNYNHQSWWLKNLRRVYGKDTDFNGPNGYLNIVPDTEVPIKWLPNLGQTKIMFMQTPGNLQFLEFIAGEMFNVKIKEDMELVKAWSTWKEGTTASFVGPTFKDLDSLKANEYELQYIFINKFCQDIAPDETKLILKKKTDGFWFLSGENTQATVLTDIENARKGYAYIIECGSTTNATQIKKTGRFDAIESDWTPTKAGDYIMVILNSHNKFIELERCVDGKRTINEKLQPNIPGAR